MYRPLLRFAVLSIPLLTMASAPLKAQMWVERSYVPVETMATMPLSQVYTTSYLDNGQTLPAVSLYPTSYSMPLTTYNLNETAYIVPTTTTTIMARPYRRYFARRPLFRSARYYEYAVQPTVYLSSPLVQSSYSVPFVPTSMAMCCETAATAATAVMPMTSMPSQQSRPIVERAPASAIESQSASGAEPALSETQARSRMIPPTKIQPSIERNTGRPAPITSKPAETEKESPSPPLVPEPANSTEKDLVPPRTAIPKFDDPAPLPGTDLPAIPNSPSGEPNTPGELIRRDSRKPVLSAMNPGRPVAGRTLLEGRVLSDSTSQPLEGVMVTLTDRMGRFVKTASSDLQGRYRVSLPDGEWRVQVTSNSGRLYEVSRLTVAGGFITDEQDRPVGGLLITR